MSKYSFKSEITIENGLITNIIKAEKSKITIISDNDIENSQVYEFDENSGYISKGLIDSHAHIFGLGVQLLELNLSKAESIEEIIYLCKKYLEKGLLRENEGVKWLIGRGWNHENWTDKSLPNKDFLDVYFPNICVYLTRIDGHSVWVNSRVMEIAEINKDTPNPIGGEIIKDNNGNPNGLLIDNAMDLVKQFLPRYNKIQIENYLKIAIDNLLSVGLTEIHDMDVHPNILEVFKKLDSENKLKIKVKSYVSAQNDEWKTFDVKNTNTTEIKSNLQICGLKFYSDGALGSRGAYLLENYSDAETKGLLFLEENDFLNKIIEGATYGWQIVTHAIGDGANRFVLDTYIRFREQTNDYKTILRIEHAQIVHPDDLHKFSKYKIFATVQPTFCLSDFNMAQSRLGKRVSYAYPWKTLIDAGVVISGSSDFPIEPINPLLGIDYLTQRIVFDILSIDDNSGKLSYENVDFDTAIQLYTETAEIMSNSELFAEKGYNYISELSYKSNNEINQEEIFSQLFGQEANLTIFKNQILENINNTSNQVLMTIVNGKVVYQSK